jgi:hypothetical protein
MTMAQVVDRAAKGGFTFSGSFTAVSVIFISVTADDRRPRAEPAPGPQSRNRDTTGG